jgi:hypothetical protein
VDVLTDTTERSPTFCTPAFRKWDEGEASERSSTGVVLPYESEMDAGAVKPGSWGHGGMARGTQFELKVYPERDAVLVVMSNYNTIAGPELASALDHLVRNEER